MMTVPDLDRDLAEIVGLVAAAQHSLGVGRAIEIDQIPGRVERVCAQVQALPQAEAAVYSTVLARIVTSFDALRAAMTGRKTDLDRRLADLTAAPGAA